MCCCDCCDTARSTLARKAREQPAPSAAASLAAWMRCRTLAAWQLVNSGSSQTSQFPAVIPARSATIARTQRFLLGRLCQENPVFEHLTKCPAHSNEVKRHGFSDLSDILFGRSFVLQPLGEPRHGWEGPLMLFHLWCIWRCGVLDEQRNNDVWTAAETSRSVRLRLHEDSGVL